MKFAFLRQGLDGAWCPSLGPSGNLLLDRSGYGNHSVLTNMDAPTDWVASRYGWALDFDGVNDSAVCQRPILLGAGDFTISAWILLRVLNDDQSFISNYGSGAGNTGGAQFSTLRTYISPPLTANVLTFYLGSHLQGSTVFTTLEWYHVAASRRGGVVTLWVNGREDGSGTRSNSIASTVGLTFGSATNYAGEEMTGQLDDIRAYRRSFTGQEMRLLASEPGIGIKPERTSVFFGAQLFSPAWASRSNQMIGGGVC